MATIKSHKYKIWGNRFAVNDPQNFISAIKEIRTLTGSGLKEAKDAYEGIAPLYFELIKDGSQKSLFNEKSLIDIQEYGGNVTLESTSGIKDMLGEKAIEERYRIRAKNALKRYIKKLIDNDQVQHAQEIINTLLIMK